MSNSTESEEDNNEQIEQACYQFVNENFHKLKGVKLIRATDFIKDRLQEQWDAGNE